MFTNLLAAMEADINAAVKAMHEKQAANQLTELQQLQNKKRQLVSLVMQYVALENQYREVSGANSIY